MSYIEISTTGNISGAKRYAFTYEGSEPVQWDVPTRTGATLEGGRYISFGVGKKKWTYEVQIRYVAPDNGYAAMADMRSLFEASSIAGNVFKFRDNPDSGDTTVYDVILLNKDALAPKPLSPRWYTRDGVWRQTLELQQV